MRHWSLPPQPPDGSPLLALAAALSLLPLVDVLDLETASVPAVVLSVLAGRRMATLRPARYIFAALAATGLLVSLVQGSLTSWIVVLLAQFFTVLLPWWAGSWWRQRAELVRAGWERAERLQREKALATEQARLRERARIAQDMHDSLGHELSLMALVAGGLELAPDLDETHRAAVAQLRAGAVTATERLHEIIGLLAEEPTPEGAEEDIVGLVRRARLSGVSVVLEEHADGASDAQEWPAATRHAARRVVQEALTNAVRHAPGALISVRVGRSADELVVRVANEAPATAARAVPSPRAGTGLISLDERVRLAGGSLSAGPCGEGFAVVAHLPRVPPVPPAEEVAPGAPAREDPDDQPADLRLARGRARRHLLRASTVPLAVAGVLGATLLGLYVYTVQTTSLEPTDFERLRLGQPRAEFAGVLPQSVSNPSPLLVEPSAPAGSDCEYYRADDNVLDLSESMYRLCFDEGVLVAKDALRRR
ncbi:histidine kinase [Streptomyces sp. MP131-18]|uniref:sensor histidine kinase n=1 Tax=Streptomyces sp. MP131-18 TaxID=1857892 RepID=UPI0009C89F96|nr:histidine kinase [Streptomyces sp. MP131-18]ONK12354.1 Sensor histidine kinase DesK [Streptomyces sp. MP131-18]